MSPEHRSRARLYGWKSSGLTEKLQLTCVGHPGGYQLVQHVLWDGSAVPVVAGHPPQGLLLPNPVLEDLRRHLHEVRLHLGSTEF